MFGDEAYIVHVLSPVNIQGILLVQKCANAAGYSRVRSRHDVQSGLDCLQLRRYVSSGDGTGDVVPTSAWSPGAVQRIRRAVLHGRHRAV